MKPHLPLAACVLIALAVTLSACGGSPNPPAGGGSNGPINLNANPNSPESAPPDISKQMEWGGFGGGGGVGDPPPAPLPMVVVFEGFHPEERVRLLIFTHDKGVISFVAERLANSNPEGRLEIDRGGWPPDHGQHILAISASGRTGEFNTDVWTSGGYIIYSTLDDLNSPGSFGLYVTADGQKMHLTAP
jgi:hypothetical protein